MHRRRYDLWRAGIVVGGVLLLLALMAVLTVSVADAHGGISGVPAAGTVTVQATPAANPTIAAETAKEQLRKLQFDNDRSLNAWLWNNGATILSSFFSILVIVIGALIAFWRWRGDQRTEQEKRAEERFQKAVEGLGNKDIESRVGSAVALRTFLRPGYEQFYRQTFDLACAYLLLRKAAPNADLNAPLPLDPLSEALIIIFRESFPYVRDSFSEEERSHYPPPYFNATGIQLDNAYLSYTDLKEAWLREAYLRQANLWATDLRKANLKRAKLAKANLAKSKLDGADLSLSDLSEAYLKGADPEAANYLDGTIMHGVKGLTEEQLKACKAKGAIVDEDAITNPAASLATSAPPPQQSS
jgi:hypothetical protein